MTLSLALSHLRYARTMNTRPMAAISTLASSFSSMGITTRVDPLDAILPEQSAYMQRCICMQMQLDAVDTGVGRNQVN